MSEASHEAELLYTIAADASLKFSSIAVEAGIAEGQVSRYLNGQYPPPARLLRTLWKMTRDPRILEYLGGDDTEIVAVDRPRQRLPQEAFVEAISAAHDFHMTAHAMLTTKVMRTVEEIERAEQRLLSATRLLARISSHIAADRSSKAATQLASGQASRLPPDGVPA